MFLLYYDYKYSVIHFKSAFFFVSRLHQANIPSLYQCEMSTSSVDHSFARIEDYWEQEETVRGGALTLNDRVVYA